MLENLQTINVFAPSFSDVLTNITVSLVCSFIISLIYRFTYRGPGYSESFVNSIVFLSIITTLVIMIIGNNLARAFGLVGALSIIRFRTAIKDTMDIVYIFLALAIGMACGVEYYKLAIAGTLFVGTALILFSKSNFNLFLSNQYMLQCVYSNKETEVTTVTKLLSSYCNSYEIISVRSNEAEATVEYSYYIRIKKNKDVNYLISEMNKPLCFGRRGSEVSENKFYLFASRGGEFDPRPPLAD
ncbi:MAG: hypothetical protein FD143_1035 [Ignavibacteria bacterium]|nr:MAG: hypothetical protein FD143_1035 [Ignavibacteria bacterium]